MSKKFSFDEETVSVSSRQKTERQGMTDWLVTHSGGFIKNQAQAKVFLLAFIVVAFIVIVVLNFGGSSAGEIKAPPGRQIINEPGVPPRLSPL
jgi:antibiotic biosynthesis monooxygenase (ABM) superfamily enzyme